MYITLLLDHVTWRSYPILVSRISAQGPSACQAHKGPASRSIILLASAGEGMEGVRHRSPEWRECGTDLLTASKIGRRIHRRIHRKTSSMGELLIIHEPNSSTQNVAAIEQNDSGIDTISHHMFPYLCAVHSIIDMYDSVWW